MPDKEKVDVLKNRNTEPAGARPVFLVVYDEIPSALGIVRMLCCFCTKCVLSRNISRLDTPASHELDKASERAGMCKAALNNL